MAAKIILTARQEQERATWQYRAVQATRGNQSRLGCILLAVLGKNAKNPPWFGRSAIITSDGFVLANFCTAAGEVKHGALVCNAAELTANFRGLADHLKLGDKDREAMFVAVRQWIAEDYRPNGGLFK